MIEARMGARAVVAARLIERAADVRLALDKVIDDAKAGNTAQAKTLLGYLVAAFPDVQAQAEGRGDSEAEALTSMSTSQLRLGACGGAHARIHVPLKPTKTNSTSSRISSSAGHHASATALLEPNPG